MSPSRNPVPAPARITATALTASRHRRLDLVLELLPLVLVLGPALLGVSTRRVEKLVQTLGIDRLSKSQVSVLAKSLDGQVAAFRSRPLDAGPYTYVWIDALTMRVREGGRIVNVSALVATGVNADGHREILGLDVATGEDGASWLAFLRGPLARGLTGVRLVVSDAHEGLQAAIGATLTGGRSHPGGGPGRPGSAGAGRRGPAARPDGGGSGTAVDRGGSHRFRAPRSAPALPAAARRG